MAGAGGQVGDFSSVLGLILSSGDAGGDGGYGGSGGYGGDGGHGAFANVVSFRLFCSGTNSPLPDGKGGAGGLCGGA